MQSLAFRETAIGHPDKNVSTVSWIAPTEGYELPFKNLLNNK